MTSGFQRICLTGRAEDPPTCVTIERVAEFLSQRDKEVSIDFSLPMDPELTACELSTQRPNCAGKQTSKELSYDLVIVVGGDGTLLSAARRYVHLQVPLLGINLGRLGFLNDISPHQLEALDAIMAGNYVEDARMMLDVSIRQGDDEIRRGTALNDAVLHKWNSARMIEFDIFVDQKMLNAHRSDGMIISTPTGSTAYALSSGGPIMVPEIDAFLLTPVSAHTLSSRPVVVKPSSQITIKVKQASLSCARISCDGQYDLPLSPFEEDSIEITALPQRLRLIHPLNHDFFDILRTKLNWGDRSQPKKELLL